MTTNCDDDGGCDSEVCFAAVGGDKCWLMNNRVLVA